MCYAANAITGCVHSVTSSTIDAILLDYNGTSTVPINPEQFWACRCYWFYQCYQSESNENVGNIDYIFLNMVNNLRIYMYNSRSFAEKYTEIHWCIDIPIGINLASTNDGTMNAPTITLLYILFCTDYFQIPLLILFSAQSLHSRTIRRTLKHSANAIA